MSLAVGSHSSSGQLYGNASAWRPSFIYKPKRSMGHQILLDLVVFRILADNITVMSLIPDLTTNCTTYISNSSTPPNDMSRTSIPYAPPYTFSNVTGPANTQAEQVVLYYRASSLALTLNSYNNTTTYSVEGTPDTPVGTKDVALLDRLNTTIGLAAPLVGSARTAKLDTPLSSFFVFLLVWWLRHLI